MNEQKAMKARKALRDMKSAKDLKKAGLTLSDYQEALRCASENATVTTYEAVAMWYKRQGFEVTKQGADGIGWTIR